MRAFASKKKLLSKRKLATWSKQYMTWQQTIDDEKEDAYEEGLAEGREAGRAEGIS
jgi:flagellar biosynthesis/type III secretory pathway protein FliH